MTNTTLISHFAAYNQWMNRKIYDAAAAIDVAHLHQDRGAFFGSVFGTLNHLVVGDTLWLQRLATHPAGFASLNSVRKLPTPTALDQPLCSSLAELTSLRATLDDATIAFCAEVSEQQLAGPLDYTSTKGISGRKQLSDVLMHVFNHQTHHRGQVTTLFYQLGVDIGATDLILLLPNAP